MKIYCKTCNKYILDTSPEFILGGPYDGSMFQKVTHVKYQKSLNFPKLVKTTRKGSLTCPMCDAALEGRDGVILTEHGRVRAGQKTIDTRISFIYPNLKLKTKGEWSTEMVEDRVGDAEKERQKEIDEMEPIAVMEQDDFGIERPGEVLPVIAEPEKTTAERNREIIKMSKSMTYKEIAEKVGLTPVTVGNIVRKARK